METTRIIGGIAFVAAFFAASLLALWIAGCARRSRHGSEAALLSGADSSRMQHLLRNGIPSLKPLSNELLKVRAVERFIERLQNALAERDTETYPQSLTSLLLGGALAILILGSRSRLRSSLPLLRSSVRCSSSIRGSPNSKTAITRACAKNFRAPYMR